MAYPPTGAQPRPYRDYLTPSLHRRFNNASRYTLLLCYLISCWMSRWDDILWSWFPIGPTGIRALLLFIPALTLYILRVATWHVGQRQTETPVECFTKYFFRKTTIMTFIFYIASAWFYGEVYIWSSPKSSKLGYTEQGRAHERLKLNERPLYLRFLFLVLAIGQTCRHLWKDFDKIEVAVMKPRKEREGASGAAPKSRTPRPREVLLRNFSTMVQHSAFLSLATAFAGTFFYFLGPRHLIWERYYNIGRYFVSLSKTSKPSGLAPFPPLFLTFAMEGGLLTLLWQFVNKAFDLYIAQEPLKNDRPITSDSKDPNGTLLNGLKSKKDAVKAIAFWELALITDSFPDRRKTIYMELERKKAPTFQQVTDLCLAEVGLLIRRINVALDPSYNPESENPAAQRATGPLNLVPQIAKPLKEDEITGPAKKPTNAWEKFGASTAGIAKSHSSTVNSQNAYGREAIRKSEKKVKEGAQQAETAVSLYFTKFVSSPFGYPFRHSLRRTANLVVLGAPYSRISLICNAITALTNLAGASLKEDELGRFHEGVAEIVRVFTNALKKIDDYLDKAEIHWSDKETLTKKEAERRTVPEIEEVKECLRDGIEKIVGTFNEYLSGMGLSSLEIMEAKKCISRTPELLLSRKPDMEQVRGAR